MSLMNNEVPDMGGSAAIDGASSDSLPDIDGAHTVLASNDAGIGSGGASGSGLLINFTMSAPAATGNYVLSITGSTLNNSLAGQIAHTTAGADMQVTSSPDGSCAAEASPTPPSTPTPTPETPTPTATPTPAGCVVPANDNFASATVVESLPFSDSLCNTFATYELGEPFDCPSMDHTVWYDFTPSSDGKLQADTRGSDFGTVLAVYTGADFDSMVLVACNNDEQPGVIFTSLVRFNATAGQTYHFEVGGYHRETGNLNFHLFEVVVTPTPSPTPTPTPTATPGPTPTPTPTPGPTPTPTATPPGVARRWGDVDCGGSVNIGDAQKTARFLVNLPVSQTEPCPDIRSGVGVSTAATGAVGASAAGVVHERLVAPAVESSESLALARDQAVPEKNPRLSSHIARLIEAERQARTRGEVVSALYTSALPPDLQAMTAARIMRIDGDGDVQVYVQAAGRIQDAITAVERAGGRVQRFDDGAAIVQASVPIGALEALAAQPSVKLLRLPDYGFVQAGSVTTQGDSILKANLARSSFGIDGGGVRIGVISDGVAGIGSSQASGDLGSVNITSCNVAGTNPQLSGAEGTAMLEIVHDLAPGAELWFGNFGFGTALDFNAAVDCLAANTDVVVDDVIWFNAGPYDGTSFVSANTSAELNRSSNRIRAYVNAVGNQQLEHYQDPYVPCAQTTVQLFSATANTLDLGGFGARCDNPLFVPAGGTLVALLEWDDPWGASCNDYDVYLFAHNSATLLAGSTSPQTCSQNPSEIFVWQNPSSNVVVDLVINKFSGAARTFDLFTVGAQASFLTPFSSVPNQSDAGGGVISVGAINASEPGNDLIAYYSSLGPTNDGRTKPDITGIDCVTITGAGGFHVPFCGTSAAAPHIAGIAALLLQCRPDLKSGEAGDNPASDRNTLRSALLGNAVDLGPGGTDNIYGAGRADAAASADSMCRPGRVWGDVDCGGAVNIGDAQKIARALVNLPVTQSEPCPDIGQLVNVSS